MFLCGWPPGCLKVSAQFLMFNRMPETIKAPVCVPQSMSDVVLMFLKYNSTIFHFTLASTTGGKDLGFVVGIKITQRPNLSISCWFGLLCFCFFSLALLVWHVQFHVQSAMEAKGLRQFYFTRNLLKILLHMAKIWSGKLNK